MAYYRVAGALAAYRAGDFHRALSLLDASTHKILGPMPLLIQAMAQQQLGHDESALDALARAVERYNWDSPPAYREDWMYHILRREAESLLRATSTHAP